MADQIPTKDVNVTNADPDYDIQTIKYLRSQMQGILRSLQNNRASFRSMMRRYAGSALASQDTPPEFRAYVENWKGGFGDALALLLGKVQEMDTVLNLLEGGRRNIRRIPWPKFRLPGEFQKFKTVVK